MFKRNQIDEALVQAVESTYSRLDPPAILTRIKRLLDADRKLVPSQEGAGSGAYAFYDGAAEGSGRDIMFSAYAVWALLIAYRLMACGLPQGRAVYLMRHFRESLEREHARLSRLELANYLNIKDTVVSTANAAGQESMMARGTVVERLNDMVFFCVHADLEVLGLTIRTINEEGVPRPDNICRGKAELERRLAIDAFCNSPTLVIELMNPFIQLTHLLSKTKPARRGRRRGS